MPPSCACRASSDTRVVFPWPGSPAKRISSRPSPLATRLAAVSRRASSFSRPMTPTAGRWVRRVGSGTLPDPGASASRGSQETWRVSMGSGRPFSSSSPSEVKVCELRRPALARTRSEARICPPSARAQRRAASMTGSPK